MNSQDVGPRAAARLEVSVVQQAVHEQALEAVLEVEVEGLRDCDRLAGLKRTDLRGKRQRML